MNRLRGESGLVGRSTVFLLVLVILFGVCAVEGGSILFTRLSLQDTADAAANQSAGTYFNSNNFQQAEQTAKEGLRLARTRQEVGVGTQLEVRDAELKLTQAQLNVVASLVDGREAEAALRRAQGG